MISVLDPGDRLSLRSLVVFVNLGRVVETGKNMGLVFPTRKQVRLYCAAGVRIAMGTDSGVTPHGQNLDELPLLADAGMTPVQVLQSATSAAAEFLRMDSEVGTVEVGKKADMVVVTGDPMDLRTIHERIRMVVFDGKIIRSER